ncbi:BTAD domain-containing putative transcriptional regulator [Pseudolysinimonas sp.]|jgi:DNA-binding SARP family transcriptional activator/DNA-binding HxlR family transcriptional regulator|uniref:BTAD domain-containing putative transcriptional regulator n=1 Tax=Pseudolysinimonas sp. TaxID=2680009 RepID=UPI003783A88A
MMQFDRWSLPVIGEALLRGTSRREDFQSFLGIAPDILNSRLASLVAAGILALEIDPEGVEHFTPTPKGRALEVALHALNAWSREWDPLSTGDLLDIVDVVATPTSADPSAGSDSDPPTIELCVLEGFELSVDGERVDLSPGSQRLLVFLALRERAITRIALAGTMWPDVSEGRAGDSLRSAIARLEPRARSAIRMSSTGLLLSERVSIDLRDAQALAHRLVQNGDVHESDLGSASVTVLGRDLLPDWYDDWIVAEAEDWRYLRMNTLESLARRLIADERFGEAALAARAAIRIDPLRETPQLILVRVQLAMGNRGAALGSYEHYRILLDAAVGLAPTQQFADLVGSVAD